MSDKIFIKYHIFTCPWNREINNKALLIIIRSKMQGRNNNDVTLQ